MTTNDMILPELRPKTRHPSVPRRYEETRPVIVQDFSHRRIIDLGTEFHQHLTKELNKEKEYAVQLTERAVWAEADDVKDAAVEAARSKLQLEHEKHIKKLNKTHERNLKEELIHLSTQMDRLRQDDINQVKRDAEIKQQEAVRRTEQLWQEKLIRAVDAARCEEQIVAAKRAEGVARQYEVDTEKLQRHLTSEKEAALANQKARLEKEKSVAIATAREEEQATADQKMDHMKELLEKQVRILHCKIKSLERDISCLKRDNNTLTQHRVKVQQELVETREEFQRFINTVHPFNKSESAYVIPPISSFNMLSEEMQLCNSNN